jgi:hypothetical protein
MDYAMPRRTPAVAANAIVDARHDLGVRHIEIPDTPTPERYPGREAG